MSAEIAAKPDPSRCKILESRQQYRACHIHVPDVEGRLAAIVIRDRYYSLFKVINDPQKALQVAAKLVYRGDEVAMTRTIKGDVIWVYEPEAREAKVTQTESQRQQALPSSRRWKLLASEYDYQPCQIRVPDVAKPMLAIYTDRQYYSYLRTVPDQKQAIDLADRLAHKGQITRITHSGQTWQIWVLESEASIHG